MTQSAIMNVADAVFEAWKVWNDIGGAKGDDAIFEGEAEVHYEPGDGVDNSFYNGCETMAVVLTMLIRSRPRPVP